eukprot:scaffold91632_cov54-Attheya_sp.AAC.3
MTADAMMSTTPTHPRSNVMRLRHLFFVLFEFAVLIPIVCLFFCGSNANEPPTSSLVENDRDSASRAVYIMYNNETEQIVEVQFVPEMIELLLLVHFFISGMAQWSGESRISQAVLGLGDAVHFFVFIKHHMIHTDDEMTGADFYFAIMMGALLVTRLAVIFPKSSKVVVEPPTSERLSAKEVPTVEVPSKIANPEEDNDTKQSTGLTEVVTGNQAAKHLMSRLVQEKWELESRKRMKRRNATLLPEVERLQKQIVDYQTQMAALEEENDRAATKIIKLTAKEESRSEDTETNGLASDVSNDRISSESDNAKNHIAQISSERDILIAEIAGIKADAAKKIDELMNEKNELESQKVGVAADEETLSKVQKLQDQIVNYQMELSEVEEENDRVQQQIRELLAKEDENKMQPNLADLELKRDSSEKLAKRLSFELLDANDLISRLSSEKKVLCEKNQRHQEKEAMIAKEESRIKADLQNANETVMALESQINTLSKQMELYSEEKRASHEELKTLKASLKSMGSPKDVPDFESVFSSQTEAQKLRSKFFNQDSIPWDSFNGDRPKSTTSSSAEPNRKSQTYGINSTATPISPDYGPRKRLPNVDKSNKRDPLKDISKSSKKSNHYASLELDATASLGEVKKAYRKVGKTIFRPCYILSI